MLVRLALSAAASRGEVVGALAAVDAVDEAGVAEAHRGGALGAKTPDERVDFINSFVRSPI